MSGGARDDILQSDEHGAYKDERIEEGMGAISRESDAGQLNDTIAMDRDARTDGRTTCCVVVETTSTSVEC